MVKTASKRRKPFVILAIFLAAWWLMPIAFKLYLRDTFHSFQAPVWEFGSRGADLGEYWSLQMRSQDDLIAKGIEASRKASGRNLLSETESDLSEEHIRLLQLKEDINQLQNQLGLDGPPRFKPVVARVTKRELNAWWQRIHLRKGEEHGIRKGCGVIFSGGVVGRIEETSSRSSVVQLVTSHYFRIAASFTGDKLKQPVTFQGGGSRSFSAPFGFAKDAPNNNAIAPTEESPRQLCTSHFSEAFPPNVPIGEVVHLKVDPNGLFRTGRVVMDKKLLTLREVTVLVPLNIRLSQ